MPAGKKKSLSKKQLVSAQVVLRPASGKSIRGNVAITSKNLKDFLPTPEAATKVSDMFAANGFATSSLVGNNFTITASIEVFERVFRTHLHQDEHGAIRVSGSDPVTGLELPLRALPKEISSNIEAVTFTPPPDFGPTPQGPWQ